MRRGRAPCCEKVGLNKGSWSPAEDLRLIDYIQKYGHGNWRALPKLAGLLRCGKSCRLRWINYLKPDTKRGNFSKEEEETIIKLHGMLGNKWSKIASCLPGRTDNEIKNVWNTHLKKRLVSKEEKTTVSGHKKNETHTPSASSSITSYSYSDGNEIKSRYEEPNTNASADSKSSLEMFEIPIEPNMDLWDIMLDDDTLSSQLQYQDMKFNEVSEIPTYSLPEFIDSDGGKSQEDIGLEDGLVIDPELLDVVKGDSTLAENCTNATYLTSMDNQHQIEGSKEWLENLEKELGLWDNEESFVNNNFTVDHQMEGDAVVSYFLKASSMK